MRARWPTSGAGLASLLTKREEGINPRGSTCRPLSGRPPASRSFLAGVRKEQIANVNENGNTMKANRPGR